MSQDYNADSIQTLSFRDAIRSRVSMYMGSADNQGVLQCVREIITNSIDEYTMGYGDRIRVTLDKDNTVTVHIRHIREKIEINPKEPRYLKVVWGVGYKIEKQQ